MATILTAEKLTYNIGETARLCGISRTCLWRLRERHDIYKPTHIDRYHVDHINILSAIFAGALTEDDALEQLELNRIELRDNVVATPKPVIRRRKRNDTRR